MLLPAQADNSYRGHKLAVWILGFVALLNGVIGFNSAFNARDVATNADGIPLGTFTADAAQTAVSLFALLGIGRIVMFALCVVILFRYRSLVPVAFSLLLIDQLGGQLIHHYIPLPRVGNPPASFIIPGIIGATALGLGLSLWKRSA